MIYIPLPDFRDTTPYFLKNLLNQAKKLHFDIKIETPTLTTNLATLSANFT